MIIVRAIIGYTKDSRFHILRATQIVIYKKIISLGGFGNSPTCGLTDLLIASPNAISVFQGEIGNEYGNGRRV